MEEELWELDRKGIKKVKGKRVDEFGRRMFDTQGNYILPEKRISTGIMTQLNKMDDEPRISTGIMSELNKMDDKPRKEWYKKQMKIRAQRISEEMEFGNE